MLKVPLVCANIFRTLYVGRSLLHPGVGLEGLSLDDANCGQLPHNLWIERLCRFLLHQVIDHLEIAEVVGRDRIHRLAGALCELDRLLGFQERPIQFVVRRALQRGFAVERGGDAGARSPGTYG